MRLYYENNKFSVDGKITEADTIITLISDVTDINIFGIFTFKKDITSTVQFVYIKDGKYQGRLIVTEEMLPYLGTVSLKLSLISVGFEKYTNEELVTFNVPAIKLSIKKVRSTELSDISKRLSSLEQVLSKISAGHKLNLLTIDDTSYIRKGMVPVALEGGGWMAAYPFANMVVEVNDMIPVDGKIVVTPDKIKYGDSTLQDYLLNIVNALTAITEVTTTQANEIKEIRTKFNELLLEFETYKNQGLV